MSDLSFNGRPVRLRTSNLFSNGSILVYENNTSELNRVPVSYRQSRGDQFHTVKRGETLDLIAYNFYRKLVEKPEWWWWVIADANEIENPLFLDDLIGQEILIPDIVTFQLVFDNG